MSEKDYDREIEPTYSSGSSSGSFSFRGAVSEKSDEIMEKVKEMHNDANPNRGKIKSYTENSIAIWLDATGSNIDFAKIFHNKVPGLFGGLKYPGCTIEKIRQIDEGKFPKPTPYLNSFDLFLGYVGDANCDDYPLQRGDFCLNGRELDIWLEDKLSLAEKGGGAGTEESFEIAAFDTLRNFNLGNPKSPFFFMVVDEAPYPYVKRSQVKELLGNELQEDLETKDVFKELYKKFKGNVFIFQNPYQGRYDDGSEAYPDITDRVLKSWKEVIPREYHSKIIKIYEEKSIVDLMTVIIAVVSGERDKTNWEKDLKSKEQTDFRINNIKKSLGKFFSSFHPIVKDFNLDSDDNQNSESSNQRL